MRYRTQAHLRLCGGPQVAVKTVDDWDQMFDALEARLRQLAGSQAAPAQPAALLPAALHDCAEALGCLHDRFALETGRRRRLELEAFDARMARARSHWQRPAALAMGPLGGDDAHTHTQESRP
jgi:hypothetical protein